MDTYVKEDRVVFHIFQEYVIFYKYLKRSKLKINIIKKYLHNKNSSPTHSTRLFSLGRICSVVEAYVFDESSFKIIYIYI